MKFPLVAALALCVSIPLAAERVEDFHEAMEELEAADKVLKKLDKKTGPEALKAAETYGRVYEDMIQFWRQRGDDKAVKWSVDGKAASVQMAAAAFAGDADKAVAAFKAVSDTCTPCHNAWRERGPDGKYRIVKRQQQPAAQPGQQKK
jgi:cytochrome c556